MTVTPSAFSVGANCFVIMAGNEEVKLRPLAERSEEASETIKPDAPDPQKQIQELNEVKQRSISSAYLHGLQILYKGLHSWQELSRERTARCMAEANCMLKLLLLYNGYDLCNLNHPYARNSLRCCRQESTK